MMKQKRLEQYKAEQIRTIKDELSNYQKRKGYPETKVYLLYKNAVETKGAFVKRFPVETFYEEVDFSGDKIDIGECDCDIPFKRGVAKKEDNMGRLFYTCANKKYEQGSYVGGCNKFKWGYIDRQYNPNDDDYIDENPIWRLEREIAEF